MRKTHLLGLIALAVAFVAVVGAATYAISSSQRSRAEQAALDPFYSTPVPMPSALGSVVRREPLGVSVAGGSAERMLYVSERPDGTRAVSGAMLFIPDAPPPPGGRPVIAWEHGTLGMGDACVPSRSSTPLADMATWIGTAMSLGWVVVATDYVGLGTNGPNQYLIAEAEVRDVVNAVRAAREIPEAFAGTRYATFGHSQGGHASIWTGHLGPSYAPELTLVAVAAAAPALELPQIASAQWDSTVGWVIGSDLIESWPTFYPDLPVSPMLTQAGASAEARLAAECIKAAGLEALARETAGQHLFASDPTASAPWLAALRQQTPRPLPASMPVFIAQGTADEVVLPWPNAMLEEAWCASGAAMNMLWLGNVNHQDAALVGGPAAIAWLAERFAGNPAGTTCGVPPAVSASPM